MKVGFLAGGLGSRLAEETEIKPKPMVEVGGRPILWHLMKYYEHFGHNEFVVALGYKGEYIKRQLHASFQFEEVGMDLVNRFGLVGVVDAKRDVDLEASR